MELRALWQASVTVLEVMVAGGQLYLAALCFRGSFRPEWTESRWSRTDRGWKSVILAWLGAATFMAGVGMCFQVVANAMQLGASLRQ